MNTENLQNSELNSENTENMDEQAKQIAGLLDAHAKRLSMRTLKQLENGRERAVKTHQQQISGVSINNDGTLTSIFGAGISGWVEHHRVASAGLLLGAIVAGFVAMQSFNHSESSDAFLLSADLPPEAFVDRGFEPVLNGVQANL